MIICCEQVKGTAFDHTHYRIKCFHTQTVQWSHIGIRGGSMLGVYMLSFPFLVETRHTVLLFTREWILTEVHEVDPFILFKNIRNVEMQLGLDLIYNIFCTNEHWELRLFMRLSKNISKWQTFTFTQCREFKKKKIPLLPYTSSVLCH